jgi:hypothetical protein
MLDHSKAAVAIGIVALVVTFMVTFSWLDVGTLWGVVTQAAPWVALALFVRFGCGSCCGRKTSCTARGSA